MRLLKPENIFGSIGLKLRPDPRCKATYTFWFALFVPGIDSLLETTKLVPRHRRGCNMPRPSTSQESKEIVLQFVNNFIERLDTEDFILPKKDR